MHEAGERQQEILNESLRAWASEHAARYSEIELLDYDPDSRPEQLISTSKTPVESFAPADDAAALTASLRRQYSLILGSAADEVLAAVAGSPDRTEPALGDDLASFLRAGKSVAVLAAHADALDDIGQLCGALAVGLGDPELIRRNNTILSKVMSFEAYRSRPIADLFRRFANVYWVVPDTQNAARVGIPGDLMRTVNATAMRAILRDMREGVLLTYAPSGTAMRREVDSEGRVTGLVIPAVSPATAKLIAKFDAYVVAALWGGRVGLSPIEPIPADAPSELYSEVMREAMTTMAALTEAVAGVPVTLEEPPPEPA